MPPPTTVPSCAAALRGVECVFDAHLDFFHRRFRSRADFDDRHAAGKFRQPFLQFLAIVVRSSFLNLFANRGHASLNGFPIAATFNQGG